MTSDIKLLCFGVASLVVATSYLGFCVVHRNSELGLNRAVAFAKCVQEARKLEPLEEKIREGRIGSLLGSRPTKSDFDLAVMLMEDSNDYQAVCRYIAPKISSDLAESHMKTREMREKYVK